MSTLASSACNEAACDTSAAFSVNGTVVDESGADIADFTAEYSVDGGPSSDCMIQAGDFSCGTEEAGVFTINVAAPGYEPATMMVTVEDGECHVVPQNVEFVLTASP